MIDAPHIRLRALGELETVKADIRGLADTLAQVPLWRPAAGLIKTCEEALGMLDRLAERFDRKLVVTLVGPCGSGKSTLLNALSGVDILSPTGHSRPTTTQVVAFCRESADAGQLQAALGVENIRIRTHDAARNLDNLILIDTPDTDSPQRDDHIPIIHEAIGLSDMLICVFDGENPKRRDHTDFLAPYVRLFDGASLVVAVNKCDRLDEAELTDTIMPEFDGYIRDAWAVEPAAVLCVSARSHLRHPAWEPQAAPRHDRDQFDQLQGLIRDTFDQAGFSVDRRLENARSLRAYLQQRVREAARQAGTALAAATDRMTACETDAMQQAVRAFQRDGNDLSLGVNVRLYQQLAQRWLGPVGWLVAVWTRILVFGTGLAALLRFGNPVRQLWGAVSTIRHHADSKKALADAEHGTGASMALLRYDSAMARGWPEIAEMLINARFAPSVRRAHREPDHGETVGRHLAQVWNDSLDAVLSRAGRRLSAGPLQLLFNLPVLGILGYAGWLTAVNFFSGTILSSDFFLHAFWTIVLILLLTFFLLQGVVRMAAGKEKLVAQVFDRVQRELDRESRIEENPVWRQVKIVRELGTSGDP
jgi:GTPase Era involved in 16S rRNA processing